MNWFNKNKQQDNVTVSEIEGDNQQIPDDVLLELANLSKFEIGEKVEYLGQVFTVTAKLDPQESPFTSGFFYNGTIRLSAFIGEKFIHETISAQHAEKLLRKVEF